MLVSKNLIGKVIRIENSNSAFRFHFIVELNEIMYTFIHSKAIHMPLCLRAMLLYSLKMQSYLVEEMLFAYGNLV